MILSKAAMMARPRGLRGSENVVRWAAKRITDGLFVDVGANVGVVSVAVLETTKTRGVAFEPNHKLIRTLVGMVTLNRVSLEVHEVALMDTPGDAILKVPTDQAMSGLATLGSPERFPSWHEYVVDVTTLDEWWNGAGQPIVDVLKVDVEGAEERVLLGGLGLLKTGPAIVLECEERNVAQFDSSVASLIGLVKSHGYTCTRRGRDLYCEVPHG